ncbi:Fe-S-cluster containining protein [Thermocatellispora tengchongensis]|uniref:Fe-S-cluster containining protein n=1 Tax=Thermocatellispora tengchongensis TaxID=1073253 RepID=A0A840PQW4_9ACTN|nr:YkgJ family cysteine cluster protein [Thermocatellispora tengchongensis]MBB5140493.1 Fe-S-cluster containining protein [Thermocatellispora tengchongensis]
MDTALEELYAQVPQPGCKGLCQDACGPIGMNPREHQRIRERGVKIPHYQDGLAELVETGNYTCPALKDGQCSVYDIRPMLCRLWGATETMPCTYGCLPEEGLLPDADGHALLAQSLDVGKPDALSAEELERLRQRFDDPKFRRTVQDAAKNNRLASNPEKAVEYWRDKAARYGTALPAAPKKKRPRRRRG